MRGPRWLVLTAGGALVAVAVLVVALVWWPDEAEDRDTMPPPLGKHAADVTRVTASGLTQEGHAVPQQPTAYVKGAGGKRIGLVFIARDDVASHRASFALQDAKPGPGNPLKVREVKAGDVITEFGVRVKILKIWEMSNPANSAIDVKLTSAA